MNEKDYPALFQAADSGSNRTQKYHLWAFRGYLICLLTGSILAFYGIENSGLAIAAAVVFIIGLLLTFLIINKNFENKWYNCRAIAESIKTSTWKYMMRAEPYENCENVQIVNAKFRSLLKSLLRQNRDISNEFGGGISKREQITDLMKKIRSNNIKGRKEFYLIQRINEQREWYSKKTVINRKYKKYWYRSLISFNFLALFCVLCRIKYPSFQYWPVEIFAVFAGACLTWTQVKKFQELSSAYSLTAHEIGIIKGGIEEIKTEENFSDFVNDAENAFSREHTQWIAKRIH